MKTYKKFNDKYIFEYDEGEDGDWGSFFHYCWEFLKAFIPYGIGFWLFCEFFGWLSKVQYGG